MAAATNQMESIALCEAIYWQKGVSAQTKLVGFGRILGFDQAPIRIRETVVTGTPAQAQQKEAKPRNQQKEAKPRNRQNSNARNGNTETGTRTRRGSRREELLTLIRSNTDGLTRGEIIKSLGLTGDKSGEMSVSNALTAMTKASQLHRQGRKYFVAGPATKGQRAIL